MPRSVARTLPLVAIARRLTCWRRANPSSLGAAAVLAATLHTAPRAQAPQPAAPALPLHFAIPYLANDTTPDALDFAAAECDAVNGGERLDCRFRQLFITRSPLDASACVVSSNGYDLSLRRDAPAHWSSAADPVGDCGVVEVTTLEDGGTTRWTMTIGHRATKHVERADCRAVATRVETYSWRNLRRTLPCTTIQPGAIER